MVESNASNKSNCVVLIVLLVVSRSKSAIKTMLFEFIYLPPYKYANNLHYAINKFKMHVNRFVKIYVQL